MVETLRLTWQRHYEQTGEASGQRQVKLKAEKDLAHEVGAICQTLHISLSTLYRYLALPEG